MAYADLRCWDLAEDAALRAAGLRPEAFVLRPLPARFSGADLPSPSVLRLFFRASNRLTTFDGRGAGAAAGTFLPAFLASISSSSASSYLSSNFEGSNLVFLRSMMCDA